VTYEDRCQIDACLSVAMSRSQIARKLGFNKSTISRELKRNQYAGRYVPVKAQEKACDRYRMCRKPYVINGAIETQVRDLLSDKWSPEQISGRLTREGVVRISHQAIYDHVKRNRKALNPLLKRHGVRGAGRYIQRNAQANRYKRIEDRPKVVARRERRGDWERDGMYIGNREQLLVLTERKSRYVLIMKMGKGIAKEVTKLTNEMLKQVPIKNYTITNDNGSEFTDSPNQGIPVYHCTPGKPQQRGTIENTIGLLRAYLPRKTDPSTVTDELLRAIAEKINSRPRKCLDYRTPSEVLFKKTVALAI
jgi:IS30 family transposase